ncbi:PAS domain-containing protein [Streptomyces sp. ID05-26A]|nr:PAS domain-containing protein [Streptomyces sp. ID05-26A]
MGEPDAALDRTVGAAEVVRQVYDEMPLMVMGYEGPEHRIIAVTGVCRTWLGRGELIGPTVREAFPETKGQQVFEIADRVCATGRPESLRGFRLQFVRRDPGVRVEVFVDFTVTPRRAPDGRVTGVVIDAADVSERVRVRRAAETDADSGRRGT